MNRPGQKIQAAVAAIMARRAKHPTSPGDKIVELRELLHRVRTFGLAHPIGLCDMARPACSCGLRSLLAAIEAELDS